MVSNFFDVRLHRKLAQMHVTRLTAGSCAHSLNEVGFWSCLHGGFNKSRVRHELPHPCTSHVSVALEAEVLICVGTVGHHCADFVCQGKPTYRFGMACTKVDCTLRRMITQQLHPAMAHPTSGN